MGRRCRGLLEVLKEMRGLDDQHANKVREDANRAYPSPREEHNSHSNAVVVIVLLELHAEMSEWMSSCQGVCKPWLWPSSLHDRVYGLKVYGLKIGPIMSVKTQ